MGALYPAVSFANSLVDAGKIGLVRHIECIAHYLPRMDVPFSWMNRLAVGGGMLNTAFTHVLQQIVRPSSARVVTAGGAASQIVKKVPVGKVHHDTRDTPLRWSGSTAGVASRST